MRYPIAILILATALCSCSQPPPSEETCEQVFERLEDRAMSDVSEKDAKSLIICDEANGRDDIRPLEDSDFEEARGYIQ